MLPLTTDNYTQFCAQGSLLAINHQNIQIGCNIAPREGDGVGRIWLNIRKERDRGRETIKCAPGCWVTGVLPGSLRWQMWPHHQYLPISNMLQWFWVTTALIIFHICTFPLLLRYSYIQASSINLDLVSKVRTHIDSLHVKKGRHFVLVKYQAQIALLILFGKFDTTFLKV